MCGIDGLCLLAHETPHPDLLARMTERMSHRGPDAQGLLQKGNIGLGHRRLKIIDLSEAANQPMSTEDGLLSITFNGEVYNYRELRAQLQEMGETFRTQSDTEVVLRAFGRWGVESFRKLNGIYAFALCDTRDGRSILYLVRDRFGTKPLFYAEAGGRLAFASEIKPFLELDWISREVDREVLFSYLKFSHVPTPRSILKGVRQLRPGRWLRFEGGAITEGTYWDPIEMARDPGNGHPRPESEWLDEMDSILARVASRQMISDVPLGCLLSGGIDSSLLTMACSTQVAGLRTFSIGYRESEFDETPYAREVAEAFGTRHQEFIVGPEDLLKLIPDIPRYYDQPLADPTLLPTLLLCQFTRREVTVALSGDGGDELFFGYTFQKTLKRLALVSPFPGPARRLICALLDAALSASPVSLGRHSHMMRKALQILQFRNEDELFAYFIGTIGPMRLDRLQGLLADPDPHRPALMADVLAPLNGLSWDKKIEQVFIRSFLTDTVLAKTDRASMAFGLEGRVPFLDNEMVEFSSRLPFDLKLKGAVKKYLPRRLLERHLPGRISARPKKGFSVPMRDWLRGPLRWLLRDYLDEARLRREGYFHPGNVSAIVKEHLGSRANHSHVLWSLVSFQMWREHFEL
ncbi:MAG: asparagine synthase (glutamine-hydrolyzing) [Candidatus Polarisedimenticolia bacterium]